MANRRPFQYPRFQAFDGNGDPLSGGSAEFFDAGTTTNRSVYSDPELSTTAPNPVTLNARGEPESGGGTPIDLYLDSNPYKIVLKDSDGNTVWTVDNYIVDIEGISEPQGPIHATDAATDQFEGTLSTDPATGQVFSVDFQSANTTTTPTFENTSGSLGALTIKTREGLSVWQGSIDGVHSLSYNGTNYIVLDPHIDQDNMPPEIVDSVSDLQSGSFSTAVNRIWLSGYYGVGTAGGGPLYRDSSDTTTADNGGTVFVDADGVRWKRGIGSFLNLMDFGARGDGSTDDTAAINQWMTSCSSKGVRGFWPKGSAAYKTGQQQVPSDFSTDIAPGTVIEAVTGIASDEQLIRMNQSSNIEIIGYGATFQMLSAEYTSGESRHVFSIPGASNIHIAGVTAKDSGGDGFYVGRDTTDSINVRVEDCTADNNRRNGVSVVAGEDIWFVRCKTINNGATSPFKGVDVEPNGDGSGNQLGVINNVHFVDCSGEGNVGPVFSYAGGFLTPTSPISVYFTNCIAKGGRTGFQAEAGFPGEGQIVFEGCQSFDANESAFEIQSNNFPVLIDGFLSSNCNQGSNTSDERGSALSVWSNTASLDGNTHGKLFARDVRVQDSDGNMNRSFTRLIGGNEPNSVIADTDVEIHAAGISQVGKYNWLSAVPEYPSSVVFTNKPVQVSTTGISASAALEYLHQKVTNEGSTSGWNFDTKNSTIERPGNVLEFEIKAAQNLGILFSTGKELLPDNVTSISSNTLGSRLKIEFNGSNWVVRERIGTWA